MAADNVVIFVAGADPQTVYGGHCSFVRSHGRAAIAAGFTPHIFCVSRQTGEITTDFGMLHRTRVPLISFRQVMMPFLAPVLTNAITRFLSVRAGPDLIHGFSTWATVGVAVQRKMRQRGAPVVAIASAYTTMRHEGWGKVRGLSSGYSPGQHLYARGEYFWIKTATVPYERRGFQQSRLVLYNYDFVRRIVDAEYGPRVPFRQIGYATESAFRFPEGHAHLPLPEALAVLPPAEAPLIVAVSRHDLRKGLDVLLRALARLREAAVPFRACLIGPGAMLAQHRRLAAKLGLIDHILITGSVPDPLPYLIHADIFVLPSIEEGSGSLSLLEALQTNNACVVSGCDGLLEDVTDGHDALLVPPGNASALSDALRRLLGDADLRGRLSAAARATFERRFSAAALTRDLGNLYRELKAGRI